MSINNTNTSNLGATDKHLNKKNKKKKPIMSFLIKTVILLSVIIATVTFIITPYRISDNTMYPSVHGGDLGLFYRLDNLYLDDIVLYKDVNNETRVGRIVATGGQTIEFFEDGGYEVNNYTVLEKIPFDTYAEDIAGQEITLKDDEYFILNDYRSKTNDSRTLGTINKSQIIGKLVYLLRLRDF